MKLPLRVPGRTLRDARAAEWPCELVGDMAAVTYDLTHARAFTRLAHVLMPDCQPGDELFCHATVQISNALANPQELVEYSAALVATPDATGAAGIADEPGGLFDLSSAREPATGRFVTRFPGFNVTGNPGGMHHAPFARTGLFTVPPDMFGDLYIAFIAYAAGQSFNAARRVTVDPWCSDMFVLKFR